MISAAINIVTSLSVGHGSVHPVALLQVMPSIFGVLRRHQHTNQMKHPHFVCDARAIETYSVY